MQRRKPRLKKPVTFRLDPETDAKLRAHAEATGLTITRIVERALEQTLAKRKAA